MKNLLMLISVAVLLASCNRKDEEVSPRQDGRTSRLKGTGMVTNPSFETGSPSGTISGWSSSGTTAADYTQTGGYAGTYSLSHWKSSSYKVTTYQSVTSIPNGIYSLTAYIQNGGGQNSCFMFAKNFGGAELRTSLPVSSGWTQIIIRGINVTNGQCQIGLYSDANNGNWCKIDNVVLTKDDINYTFLKGGDISELSYIESKGGKFYLNSTQMDCMDILKAKGFNIVRIRLYNDPGNPNYSPSNRLPAGFQNTTDVLSLAKRAANRGMQIQLTLHFSDYWTNAGNQTMPHDWASITTIAGLKTAIYNFTFDVMTKMKNQGTTPQYVSLGNETGDGILFPYGQLSSSSGGWTNYKELINSAYSAVKAVSPTTKTILHLDGGGDIGLYDWFFGGCTSNGVNYDIIGASYYPFWSKKMVSEVITWANTINAKYGKKIMIMETGYNWNPTRADGWPGQLTDAGPYETVYGNTKTGQRDFLYECFNGLKLCNNGCVIGDLYWDPVMIAVPGVGWELGGANVVSNTTLFDFSGYSLPSLDAFLNN